jgi:hypothetical protein
MSSARHLSDDEFGPLKPQPRGEAHEWLESDAGQMWSEKRHNPVGYQALRSVVTADHHGHENWDLFSIVEQEDKNPNWADKGVAHTYYAPPPGHDGIHL